MRLFYGYRRLIILVSRYLLVFLILSIYFPEHSIAKSLSDYLQSGSELSKTGIKNLSVFINSNPTIDYNDPNLNQVLSGCELDLCKAYATFITFAKSKRTPKDIARAKADFDQRAKKGLNEAQLGYYNFLFTPSTLVKDDDILFAFIYISENFLMK